jgi:hypothetical protein
VAQQLLRRLIPNKNSKCVSSKSVGLPNLSRSFGLRVLFGSPAPVHERDDFGPTVSLTVPVARLVLRGRVYTVCFELIGVLGNSKILCATWKH